MSVGSNLCMPLYVKKTLTVFRFHSYQTSRRPIWLAPVVPLVFGMAYAADMAYGSKLHRIRGKHAYIFES